MTVAEQNLKRTPLYKEQLDLGARFVDFHGWEMAIQFEGILKEHQAVRQRAGLFDVSHMGQFFVSGPDAFSFLQFALTNDLRKATVGKGVYSHLLTEQGGVVDDVIAYGIDEDRYLVVVNAGTRQKDLEHLRSLAEGKNVEIVDASAEYGMIAVQGPLASQLVEELLPGASELKRFGIRSQSLFGSTPSFFARTGYTGEDGFEIIAPSGVVGRVWQTLAAGGRSLGVVPCGLGARDTLRLEAGFPLYGQDLDEDHSPLEARCAWVVKFDKGDFVGKKALEAQKEAGLARALTGIRLLERGVPRAGAEVFYQSERCGVLTSAAFAPSLNYGIGMGYLDRTELKPGDPVEIEIRGRRVRSEVVKIPFHKKGEG